MRETTKKQLLAVLEKQLAKVTEKLEFKDSKVWAEATKEVQDLYSQFRQAKTEKAMNELEIKIKRATLRRDKASKATQASNGKIGDWVNEQCDLEEEIRTLKYLLSYSTPQLKSMIRYATTYPFSE